VTITKPFKILTFRVWHEGMGPVSFCYSDMPAGNRCGWTCLWSTSQGIVTPNQWCLPRNMNEAELLAELEDVAARDGWSQTADAEKAKKLLERFEYYAVTDFILDARQRYREYVCPYCQPHEVKAMILRHGWPSTFEEVVSQMEADSSPVQSVIVTSEEGR